MNLSGGYATASIHSPVTHTQLYGDAAGCVSVSATYEVVITTIITLIIIITIIIINNVLHKHVQAGLINRHQQVSIIHYKRVCVCVWMAQDCVSDISLINNYNISNKILCKHVVSFMMETFIYYYSIKIFNKSQNQLLKVSLPVRKDVLIHVTVDAFKHVSCVKEDDS